MQPNEDFLIEIGTEELPPKNLHRLASSFANNLENEFVKAQLSYGEVQLFATPRRIAVLIKEVAKQQQDKTLEKTGPAISSAYDQTGQPTASALGFARSCQTDLEQLTTISTPKGECLYFSRVVPGDFFTHLVPNLVKTAINQLPIPKPMLWGDHKTAFIRPVHWVLMIYGETVIPCQLFELESNNLTYGHRFHHPKALQITHPSLFKPTLQEQGYVISDYQERKENIRSQILAIAKDKGQIIIDEALLEEVTGLVEWPVALAGNFDSRFLRVPKEALISAMKMHQKCFPVIDKTGNLLPHFIFIANIESSDPKEVIVGNERVIRARLSDAEFFYHNDLKIGINQQLNQLKTIIFQNKLGTLFEKANRIGKLAEFIANKLQVEAVNAKRAGLLCKADLTSEMVGEFPELQGIMGYYYALESNEPVDVAQAIKEHYQPRFAGDELPATEISCSVALADKLDTLTGIFGISQAPTGEKDPFALRRAALGVLRIIIEKKLPLDLRELLVEAAKGYPTLENENTVEETLTFIMDRLRTWYLDQAVSPDVFAAVYARYPTAPLDFDKRIKAIQYFQTLPEATALAAANKRVSNILKQALLPPHDHYNYTLFELEAEKELADTIEKIVSKVKALQAEQNYQEALTILATLKTPIDNFFDAVMVMTENETLRNNRLILLSNLHQMFLEIADISLLQTS
jgi:glycyl-tRNA synthetase beta chain